MGFMINTARTYPISTRARLEAYAGLLLLLLGLTAFSFTRCPSSTTQNHRPRTAPLKAGDNAMPTSVVYGNAGEDGHSTKGWWVGHFKGKESGRYSEDVEMKWAVHETGTKHDGWALNQVATSMALLVQGRHRLEFEGTFVVLENVGDYVIWGTGVKHSWMALERSTVLTVRWPSLKGDQKNVTIGDGIRVGTIQEMPELTNGVDD